MSSRGRDNQLRAVQGERSTALEDHETRALYKLNNGSCWLISKLYQQDERSAKLSQTGAQSWS